MTRYRFGKTTSDTTVRRVGSLLGVVPATLTFYDAEAGGTQYVDLAADEAGTSPLIQVTSDKFGAWEVYGPDGVTAMWLDDGNPETPRVLVVAPEAAAEAATRAETAAASVARGEPNGVAPLDAAALLPEANVPSRLTAVSLGGTYAAKPRSGTKAVGQDEQVVNVLDHGAVGDGIADDTAAINSAITAAGNNGVVLLPYSAAGYAVAGTINLSKAVTLRGVGRVTLKAVGATRSSILVSIAGTSTGATVSGLTIASSGLLTGPIVFVAGTRSTVTDCTVDGGGAGDGQGILVGSGAVDATVRRTKVTNCFRAIYVSNATTRTTIERNHVSFWRQSGIYVIGNATGSSDSLRVVANSVTDAAGSVKYPIQISGVAGKPHTRVLVAGNIVVGPGLATANGGNADQIALFFCEDFAVRGNISTGGGDMGITVEGNCRRGAVVGNVCSANDACGIDIGSATYTATSEITVTGNTCVNNGQNRAGNVAADARAGIRVYASANLAIGGNVLGDDQATKTQQYGVTFTSSTNCVVGPDVDAGNALGLYFKNGAGNTNLSKVTTAAL